MYFSRLPCTSSYFFVLPSTSLYFSVLRCTSVLQKSRSLLVPPCLQMAICRYHWICISPLCSHGFCHSLLRCCTNHSEQLSYRFMQGAGNICGAGLLVVHQRAEDVSFSLICSTIRKLSRNKPCPIVVDKSYPCYEETATVTYNASLSSVLQQGTVRRRPVKREQLVTPVCSEKKVTSNYESTFCI